jgi:hypothetical protein
MPINEAGGYRRSNLTRQQQREAELAIYGRSPEPPMSPNAPQFTQAQLDQMRAILAQHDASSAGVVKEFDLNNPPQQRYVHQEYPKMLHHHEKRTSKVVNSRDEELGYSKLGYETKPFPPEAPLVDPELDEEDAAEVAALKAEIEALKKAAKAKSK